MPAITIKKPTINQLQQVLILWEKQARFHIDLDPTYYAPFTTEESITDIQTMIEKNTPHLRCAYSDETIVGFITFNRGKPSYPDTNFVEHVELFELYVEEAYRAQGIGEKLMAEAEAFAREQNISTLKILTSAFNTTVISYYQKRGYVHRQTILYKTI